MFFLLNSLAPESYRFSVPVSIDGTSEAQFKHTTPALTLSFRVIL